MVELIPRFNSTAREHLPSDFKQREVLHVTRADLQDVGILGHQVDIAIAHHFRDDSESGFALCLGKQLQAFGFQALKIVRRRSRLERTAAQHLRAGFRDALRRLHDLLFRFDRARSGHHDELVAADVVTVRRGSATSRAETRG